MFGNGRLIGKHLTKADLGLICCILAAAAALAFFFFPARPQKAASVAVIEQDGKEILRLSLGEEAGSLQAFARKQQTVRIPFGDGYNVVAVDGQSVYVSEADCPDQLCVKQGSIAKAGEQIICLPHRLMIRLEGPRDEEGLDAVTD